MKKCLISGGAGFIGSNCAARLIKAGHSVTILDNLSRKGSVCNLEWLKSECGADSFQFVRGDIRDAELVRNTVKPNDAVIHLAAQVAVTSSVNDPRNDFEINALGTLNVLEGARLSGKNPMVVFSSTNKVYGGLEEEEVIETPTRYNFVNLPFGISEKQPLNFHSPYGCSKGTADQYVRDYGRIYGFPTVVNRLSCIYGPHQFGMEDQGWVAWFLIKGLLKQNFTIYGNGKQVRDLLYIEDLINAFEFYINNPEKVAGEIFNLGGGAKNSVSVWYELKPFLDEIFERSVQPSWGDWRPGDQKIYVSDIGKAEKIIGWKPQVSVQVGIKKLHDWLSNNIPTLNAVIDPS
jgi:CDP-paratose 2-epimerase